MGRHLPFRGVRLTHDGAGGLVGEVVEPRLGAPAGLAAVQVQDNGVGYNPALQSALFKAFGRLHSAREFAGLGMGLALTAKALQRMAGTVVAQGVLDGGCCVRLTLPAPVS